MVIANDLQAQMGAPLNKPSQQTRKEAKGLNVGILLPTLLELTRLNFLIRRLMNTHLSSMLPFILIMLLAENVQTMHDVYHHMY
jgi:hypothetical protein